MMKFGRNHINNCSQSFIILRYSCLARKNILFLFMRWTYISKIVIKVANGRFA